MRVRLAMEGDADAVLALAEQQVAETSPHLPFERPIAEAYFQSGLTSGDLLLVAESSAEVVGYLSGKMCPYEFCSGIYVVLDVWYVRPDKRGTRAAVELLLEFIRWGEIVGARETLLGVNNPQAADRVAKLFERLGAERLGYQHRIIVHGKPGS